MFQTSKWRRRLARCYRECDSEKDRTAVEKVYILLAEKFSNVEVPQLFAGPDRCEAQWADGSRIVTFGSDSPSLAFSKDLVSVPVDSLHLPRFTGADSSSSSE